MRMNMTRYGVVLAAATLAACAKSPESIPPAYQSTFIYEALSCNQLAEEYQRVSQALVAASQQQSNARTNDIVGVVLIGLPVSTLSGDNIAPQIAQLKGQQEALHQQSLKKACPIERATTPTPEQAKSANTPMLR